MSSAKVGRFKLIVRSSLWLLTAIVFSVTASAAPKVETEITQQFADMSLAEKNAYLRAAYGSAKLPEELKILRDFEQMTFAGKVDFIKTMYAKGTVVPKSLVTMLGRDAVLNMPREQLDNSHFGMDFAHTMPATPRGLADDPVRLRLTATQIIQEGLSNHWQDTDFAVKLSGAMSKLDLQPRPEFLRNFASFPGELREAVHGFVMPAVKQAQLVVFGDPRERKNLNSLVNALIKGGFQSDGMEFERVISDSHIKVKLTPENRSRVLAEMMSGILDSSFPRDSETSRATNTVSRIRVLDRLIEADPELMTPEIANKLMKWCETAIVRISHCARSMSFESKSLSLAAKKVVASSTDEYVRHLVMCLERAACVAHEIRELKVPADITKDQAIRLSKALGEYGVGGDYALTFLEATQKYWREIPQNYARVLANFSQGVKPMDERATNLIVSLADEMQLDMKARLASDAVPPGFENLYKETSAALRNVKSEPGCGRSFADLLQGLAKRLKPGSI